MQNANQYAQLEHRYHNTAPGKSLHVASTSYCDGHHHWYTACRWHGCGYLYRNDHAMIQCRLLPRTITVNDQITIYHGLGTPTSCSTFCFYRAMALWPCRVRRAHFKKKKSFFFNPEAKFRNNKLNFNSCFYHASRQVSDRGNNGGAPASAKMTCEYV